MTKNHAFKVLSQNTVREPFSTRTVGARRIQCPDCGNIFNQGGSGGCFTMLWTPIACPKCGFPYRASSVYPDKTKDGSSR